MQFGCFNFLFTPNFDDARLTLDMRPGRVIAQAWELLEIQPADRRYVACALAWARWFKRAQQPRTPCAVDGRMDPTTDHDERDGEGDFWCLAVKWSPFSLLSVKFVAPFVADRVVVCWLASRLGRLILLWLRKSVLMIAPGRSNIFTFPPSEQIHRPPLIDRRYQCRTIFAPQAFDIALLTPLNGAKAALLPLEQSISWRWSPPVIFDLFGTLRYQRPLSTTMDVSWCWMLLHRFQGC